jgi:hypothetical protein
VRRAYLQAIQSDIYVSMPSQGGAELTIAYISASFLDLGKLGFLLFAERILISETLK